MNCFVFIVLVLFKQISLWSFVAEALALGQNDVDFWSMERPKDMANIKSLEVMCGKTYMEVQISFDRKFNGIIFSKGAIDQYNCIYVKPQTGSTSYSFNIMYDQCGTKPDMNGKFYENNIVIQYDKDLIEVWDEAKRLRCEWYNDYEKGITKPPIRVSDLEVVELNFRGDNVDCWMEIQHGKGPWASLVSGIVPLGTTLTMVIGIKDKQGEFDMRVKSCSAEAKNSRAIHLTDEHGCVLRPKMISQFMKITGADNRASVLTYAFFHAFKFPDSMSVNIKCKVEICRFGCPEHCQKPNNYVAREKSVSASLSIPKLIGPRYEAQKRVSINQNHTTDSNKKSEILDRLLAKDTSNDIKNIILSEKASQRRTEKSGIQFLTEKDKKSNEPEFFGIKFPKISDISNIFTGKKMVNNDFQNEKVTMTNIATEKQQTNSFVPLHRTDKKEQPLVYPTLFNTESISSKDQNDYKNFFPHGPRDLRIQKRKKRNTEEMGVNSGYKVISEVDLAFKPSFEKGVGVTVFQGRMIPEEVVYGVCIPATGFSALFVLLSLLTVIAVLVTGFVCYHRQIQKSIEESPPLSIFYSRKPTNISKSFST